MDELSKLPDHIIHSIMSRLPTTKDSIHMSTSCKALHSAWSCFMTIDLKQCEFFGDEWLWSQGGNSFLDFVEKFLENRRPRGEDQIQKLRFAGKLFFGGCMVEGFEMESKIRRIIDYALQNNVREAELDFGITYDYFSPPRRCYHLENKLYEDDLEYTIACAYLDTSLKPLILSSKSIKILTLKRVGLASQDLMLKDCACLHIFNLIDCHCFQTVSLDSNAQLKAMKIENCYGLKKVEVKSAASLESFWCESEKEPWSSGLVINISTSTTPKLKHLLLKTCIDGDTFMGCNNFSEFRYLETLKLLGSFCFDDNRSNKNRRRANKIHLVYLKELELDQVYYFDRLEIEAPSLVSITVVASNIPHHFRRTTPEIYMKGSCTNLKLLRFSRARPWPETWTNHKLHKFSQLANLETLEINSLYIEFGYLLKLHFIKCDFLAGLEFLIPNLDYFSFFWNPSASDTVVKIVDGAMKHIDNEWKL